MGREMWSGGRRGRGELASRSPPTSTSSRCCLSCSSCSFSPLRSLYFVCGPSDRVTIPLAVPAGVARMERRARLPSSSAQVSPALHLLRDLARMVLLPTQAVRTYAMLILCCTVLLVIKQVDIRMSRLR